MTQLYVGNLSADGDEKAIRALFSNYGVVREVLMKNGYAFVEFEDARSADTAMRDLNGSDILGHPMIVEPSHQQRLSSRRKPMCGRVEVVSIPPPMTLQQIEHLLTQFGPVLKMEIEESDFGMKKIVATFECQESSQRAAATYGDEHCTPRVSM
ncbi:Serine/arginine-rich splicing factor 6 [Geodia barretti]|uniref:Serine/arginine-rich splicing factor 6 n=1 Tax=Geodia barretti TaxID=519541 RepID=A0AA35W0N1_GEOBA|nr:Serine/arginine-rich splicing factor 6 [Geodia barretti]